MGISFIGLGVSLFAIAIVGVVIYFCCCRKRKRASMENPVSSAGNGAISGSLIGNRNDHVRVSCFITFHSV